MADVQEKEEKAKIEESTEKNDVVEEVEEKKDEETVEVSNLEKEIIRQIEYYFGDANLRRDKFLIEQTGKDDGWVPFTVLLTFKRLAALSTDPEVIVKALEKSEEGLIEISEDKSKIRRHPERPLPEYNEERRKEISSRTAYAKGFPLDSEISDLIEFFKPYEKVLNVQMRKYLDKRTKTYKFKGSVFVTFEKKEQCHDFVEKDKVEYKGVDLIRKWQEQYLEESRLKSKNKKGSKAKVEEVHFEIPKGTFLRFEGAVEHTTREKIKEELSKYDENIAFLEYERGDPTGHVRLKLENSAKPLLEKLTDKKLKVEEAELTFSLPSEEEEKALIEKVIANMNSKRNVRNKHKGGNRKRKQNDNHHDEPSKKQVAVEADDGDGGDD